MPLRIAVPHLLACALLSGCATNYLPVQQVNHQAMRNASSDLRHFRIPPPRLVPADGMVSAMERVRQRIWPAAMTVCRETFTHGCEKSLASMWVVVALDDQDYNAYALASGELRFTGGLMRHAGSDDEIAMVLGHEIAHIMLNHNAKTARNEGMGSAFGFLLGLGFSMEYAQYMSAEEMARLMQSSTQAFGDAGRLSYSKEMELEADALSAHIVHEAGYDLNAAKGFLVRAHRIAAAVGPQMARAAVGFLSTHPSDEKRIAHWGIVAGKARAGLTPRM